MKCVVLEDEAIEAFRNLVWNHRNPRLIHEIDVVTKYDPPHYNYIMS